MKKHIVVLFDIDKTLIDTDSSDSTHIVWTGGSPKIWISQMEALKISASRADINLHFGIATFRPKKSEISSIIIDLELNEFIDPNLVFFTNHRCKNSYALMPAALQLMSEGHTIFSNDIWIIDDQDRVINTGRLAGFNAVHANELIAQPMEQQEEIISDLFKPIQRYIRLRSKSKANALHLKDFTSDNLGKTLYSYVADHEYHLAKLLLTKRPDATKYWRCPKSNNCAIHLAVSEDQPDLELIKLLAQDNYYLNSENTEQKCILHIAIIKRHYKIVEFFLNNYSYNFTPDQTGNALHSLIHSHQYDLAKLLVTKRPEARWWSCNEDQNNAIHLAVSEDQPDLELIKLLAQNSYLGRENIEKKSALHIAVIKRHYNLVEFFLNNYSDNFTPYQLGNVLLSLVRRHQNDLAKLLLTKRPDTMKSFSYTTRQNHAIHLAVLEDKPDLELIKLLSRDNVYLGRENTEKKSALHIAVIKHHYKIVKFFLINYSYQFTPDQLGNVLLSLVHRHQNDLAKLLLTKRPDTKKTWHYTKSKNYAIHLAVSEDKPDLELIKLLSRDNAYLGRENTNKKTALDIAHKKNHTIVENFFTASHARKFGIFCDANNKNIKTFDNISHTEVFHNETKMR